MNNKLNTRKIFLEECNDGLVKVFEDKIGELENEIKYLNRKDIKKAKFDWEIFIKPLIKEYEKKIREYTFLIKRISIYDRRKTKDKSIDISSLLDNIDIVEVISGYAGLNKRGKQYLGICPLHNEKTPSFSVNREKGLWHCFGCKEGGNVISFLMKIEGKSFKEVINNLNEIYG